MVEIELKFDPNVPIPEFIPESPLVPCLTHLFSIQNLEKDYSLVMNMNSDLWVSLSFISNLECIKILCNNKYELISACITAGLQIKGDYVRRKIDFPTTDIYIRHKFEDISEKIKEFEFESIEIEANGCVMHNFNEEITKKNLYELRKLDISCEIEYVNPYVHLLNKVLGFVNNGSFVAVGHIFCDQSSSPQVYSLEELKLIYQKSRISMPVVLKKFVYTGIVRKTPTKINLLSN